MFDIFIFGVLLRFRVGLDSGWKVDAAEFVDELGKLGMGSRAVEYLRALD
jgi:hypothetical protein